MCGICGIIDYKSACSQQNKEYVQKMSECLRHRGPDHYAITAFGPATLGHTRLSIIDLSAAAHQPMQSDDERFTLVFNGEIYNFKELRIQLEQKGRAFRTNSDTEVLMRTYEEFGTECVMHLSGMFAFAIWDAHLQTLFLARDRFGQKPVFYSTRGNRFTFASEIEALFRDPTLRRSPNLNAIFHYLTIQSIPAPLCAFDGIAKLGPGECMLIAADAPPASWRYWRPAFSRTFFGTVQEAEEELDALLHKAVRTHLDSDVPLGLFLSGGVDSSLITAIACRQHDDMRSFSIGFAEQGYDERPFAREVAQLCGTRHHDEEATATLASLLPKIVRHYGEPFADSSAIPTWLLTHMAARHVTVALSGDGGDDLFGGYERFLNPFLYPAGSADTPEIATKRFELEKELNDFRMLGKTFKQLDPGVIKYHFHWARFCGQRKTTLCTPQLARSADPMHTLHLMLDHFRQPGATHPLDRIQRFELEYYLATTLMPKVDIASMAASLEVRAPLLDNAVADFALSLPASMRVGNAEQKTGGSFQNGFEPKWLLKKVAERYLPKDLVYRRKMGFGIPLDEWLRGELRELLQDTLLSSTCRKRGWIDPCIIERMVSEHMEGTARHHYGLWALFMLELWAEAYFTN